MEKIRTRFAPSPTGYMHIGNLRTALYEYLVAKSQNGEFVLRIEDTDQSREVKGATDFIYKTLKSIGIIYDEGPDKPGEYGPYIQSERLDMYKPYIDSLISEDKAYRCFCTKERLSALKEEQVNNGEFPHYDRRCSNLNNEEIENHLKLKTPFVVRQRIPRDGKDTFKDEVYGEITVDYRELEDQILLKSDGFPTYNFANVIDDHLMNITHIVRGCEYLSSTPKYNLLYDAFTWKRPIYIHLSHIHNMEGQKLSKRNGDMNFEDLINMGYLPEAILNFVALLGWSPGGEQEIFSLKEMEEVFNVKGISKSPSVFDLNKLKWMNGEYIRNMKFEDFYIMIEATLNKSINIDVDLIEVAKLLQKRISILSEIPNSVSFLKEITDYDLNLFDHKKMKTNSETALVTLKKLVEKIEDSNCKSSELLSELVGELVLESDYKKGQFLWPLRVALTGVAVSLGGGLDAYKILGSEESLKRLKFSINLIEKENINENR